MYHSAGFMNLKAKLFQSFCYVVFFILNNEMKFKKKIVRKKRYYQK